MYFSHTHTANKVIHMCECVVEGAPSVCITTIYHIHGRFSIHRIEHWMNFFFFADFFFFLSLSIVAVRFLIVAFSVYNLIAEHVNIHIAYAYYFIFLSLRLISVVFFCFFAVGKRDSLADWLLLKRYRDLAVEEKFIHYVSVLLIGVLCKPIFLIFLTERKNNNSERRKIEKKT